MAKKAVDSTITEIRKGIEAKKIILGTKNTIQGLKKAAFRRVFVTQNTPQAVKEDVERYARQTEAEVVSLDYQNDELGILCKKPYSISVLGLLK